MSNPAFSPETSSATARGPDMVYEFSEFRLDCGRFELLRKSQPLRLERKPMELLILLVSREGQLVSRAEIAERLWSSEVFVDTEHGINTAIRKLRQTLRDDPAEPKFIQTVTGVGYRFIAPVLIQSQVIQPRVPELPRGELETSPIVQPAPIHAPARTHAHRVLWLAAASALVLLFTLLLARHRLNSTAPVIRSLAVLPLDNLSGDTSQEYLAAGMTDELTTMIARNSTLRITSRTSVMQYKGAHRPLSEIARELGVEGIVEGSIARKGDQVHMTLQLIRADTDSHIWAQSFNRDTSDTALAGEAAQEIAKQLDSATPVAMTQRYVNPAAHDAYLRGKYLWYSDRELESEPYFQKATEIQPDYAAAWAGLANYYGKAVVAGEVDPRVALPLEEEASARAIALDSNLAEAHGAMAATYLIARWNPADADREILRAISLDPSNGEFYAFRADVMLVEDRRSETIELAKKAIEMAPLEHAPWLGWIFMDHREYDEALDDLKIRLEAAPFNPTLLYCRMECLRRKRSYRDAADAAAKLFSAFDDPRDASLIRTAFARGGWPAVVRWQLAFYSARQQKEYVSPVALATYHAELGEKEPTLSMLEEAFRLHDFGLLMIATDPAFDFLQSEPRFQSLVQKIGLPVTSIASRTVTRRPIDSDLTARKIDSK